MHGPCRIARCCSRRRRRRRSRSRRPPRRCARRAPPPRAPRRAEMQAARRRDHHAPRRSSRRRATGRASGCAPTAATSTSRAPSRPSRSSAPSGSARSAPGPAARSCRRWRANGRRPRRHADPDLHVRSLAAIAPALPGRHASAASAPTAAGARPPPAAASRSGRAPPPACAGRSCSSCVCRPPSHHGKSTVPATRTGCNGRRRRREPEPREIAILGVRRIADGRRRRSSIAAMRLVELRGGADNAAAYEALVGGTGDLRARTRPTWPLAAPAGARRDPERRRHRAAQARRGAAAWRRSTPTRKRWWRRHMDEFTLQRQRDGAARQRRGGRRDVPRRDGVAHWARRGEAGFAELRAWRPTTARAAAAARAHFGRSGGFRRRARRRPCSSRRLARPTSRASAARKGCST